MESDLWSRRVIIFTICAYNDDTKRHEQEYRGNESKWGNAKSDSYSPPQFRRHGSSCRKKQAEEDVPAMSPHEAAKPVS